MLVPLDLERPEVPQYFRLNHIATEILNHSVSPIDIDELASIIIEKHNDCLGVSVHDFVAKLVQAGILRILTGGVNLEDANDYTRHNLKGVSLLSSPLSIFVELSNKCNLRCAHCYTKSGNLQDRAQCDEIEISIFDLLSDASQLGVLSAGFGGGEPTLDKSLSRYVAYCTDRHIKTSISTNGVLVNKGLVSSLRNAGLGIAQISIDGPSAVHDAIRGKGVYDRAISALRLFSEYGIETRVAMTVMTYNLGYIGETANIAFSNGADRFVVFRYMSSGRSGEKLSLSRSQLRESAETLITMQEKHPDTVIGYEPLCFYPHLIKQEYAPLGPCNAGTDTLNICHDGRVTPCPHVRDYCLGVYPSETLKAIWDKAKQLGKSLMNEAPDECVSCEFVETCGGGCNWDFDNDKSRHKDKMCWKNG